jgi:broad specificity phosphatase PhoE
MITVLYLARHGETEWNARGKLQGRTDIPLNEVGRSQARALAGRFHGKQILSVTTSDLSRASETGVIVADALGVDARHVDPDLRERSFGIFEGLTRDECAERYPAEWREWVERTITPAGAESRDVAVERMTKALMRVVSRGSGGLSLVVSHGGAMRLFLTHWLGMPIDPIANGTIYRVEAEGAVFRAELWE